MAQIAEELAAHAQLSEHQEPLGDQDIQDGEDGSPMQVTYSEIAAEVYSITLHLFREDKSNDFYVSYEDAYKLIFKRLMVPDGALVSIDTTSYKKIVIELKKTVNPIDLNITQALEVRPGLKTRPLQAPDTDKVVKIQWAPMKLPNADIDEVIGIFGEIKAPTSHVVLRATADSPAWEKAMDGVKTADRVCTIKIINNIPSYIIVKGIKLKVDYSGQPKTCGRCHKYWAACPGGGKIDKCKKNKGEEKTLKLAFKQVVNRIKKKEVSPQETSAPLIPGKIPDPDQITFSGFKEDTSLNTFMAWLDANNIAFLEPMCFKGKKPGSFNITSVEDDDGDLLNLSGDEAKQMVDKLNGVSLDGRRISVTMTMLSTPTKQQHKKPETVTLDSSTEEQATKPSTSGTQKEKPAGKSNLPAVTDQTNKGKGKSNKGQNPKEAQKEPEKEKSDQEKKKEEKNRKKKEKEEQERKKKEEALKKAQEQSLEDTSDDEEIESSQPERRVMLNISKVQTQGGTSRFKSRVVGDKSKREDTSSSSGGESPTLKGKTTPSSGGKKTTKKQRKTSSFKHNNF